MVETQPPESQSGDQMGDVNQETCDRCGAFGPGRRRIFFEHGWFARKFHCVRCLRWTRIYGVIGLSLLLSLLGAVLAALSRLRH